jgi:6-phosphogluconolactonase
MRQWAGKALAAIGLWALCLMTGCNGFFVYPGSVAGGGTGGGSSTGDYVYVANATTQSLAAFSVGSGMLTPVSGSPFPLGFTPTSVVVNPANTIVYVAGSGGAGLVINAYAIGASGVLSLLTSNVAPGQENAIAISPDGRWLMGLDALGATAKQAIVDEFQIVNTSGELQAASAAGGTYGYTNTSLIINPLDLKFAPNGAYVFAAMGTGGDVVFPFNTANGAFSTAQVLQPISPFTSDQALAVSADSLYLYIARSGTSGGLAMYSIGAGGVPAPVSGSPLAAGNQPISVVINKAGTDLYVANQIDSTISGYSVANDVVAPLNPATDATPSPARALAIDNSGNYLFSISSSITGGYDISMYSYDSTTVGKLDVVTSMTTGIDPAGAVAIAATH